MGVAAHGPAKGRRHADRDFSQVRSVEQSMNVEELAKQMADLESRVRHLEDVEEINRLQRAYGYYLTNGLTTDLVDLFSDGPDTSLLIAKGEYRGKEGVRRFLTRLNDPPNKYFFHQVMLLSGVIDVNPERTSANGRWFGFGACALPDYDGGSQGWMNGVYENEYVREDGKWKIKRIRWCSFFFPADEPFDARVLGEAHANVSRIYPDSHFEPDGPPEETVYTSGFVCPCHFENPVTGSGRAESDREVPPSADLLRDRGIAQDQGN
jgi:hypothetical protein